MLAQKTSLLWLVLLTLPISTFAAKKPCITSQLEAQLKTGEKQADESSGLKHVALPPGGDLKAFESAPVVVQGGLPHGPICNQQDAEICWAYTGSEFPTALLLKKTGTLIQPSPDHLGFWNLEAQVYNNASYFIQLQARVKSGKISLKAAIKEAKSFIKNRKGFRAAPNTGFTIQPGSDEAIALNIMANRGMVPNSIFNRPISTPQQGQAFDAALTDLVSTIIKSPNKAALFGPPAADGVNTALYDLMVQKLQPFYAGSGATNSHPPYRPGDTFMYNGTQYTPGTFMTQVMQFDPSQWVQVTMTEQNKPAVLKAIKDSLTGPNPAPVPIGFAVYDQQAAQQAPYTWSADLLKANGQPQLDGGHEILIVNGRTDSSGNVIGVTAQNSWGTGIGNDVNGNPTNVAANSGFFNITTPYLDYTVPNDAPDFVFSKALVNGNPSLPPDPATIKPGKSPRLK